jgi:hypothetical protein
MHLAVMSEAGRCTMSGHRRTLVRFVQDAIDRGATTVEEIHKSIANLPLRVLEESDLLKEPAEEARRLQDHTIGKIYDVIRQVNEQVGTYASGLLAEAARRRAAQHAAARERRSPRRAVAR